MSTSRDWGRVRSNSGSTSRPGGDTRGRSGSGTRERSGSGTRERAGSQERRNSMDRRQMKQGAQKQMVRTKPGPRSLYIQGAGDLPEATLKRAFEKYGRVSALRCRNTPSAQDTRCIFIDFYDPDCANIARIALHEKYEVPGGGKLKVTWARRASTDQSNMVPQHGAGGRRLSQASMQKAAAQAAEEKPDPFTTLWVGNIGPENTPTQARRSLGEYGTVKKFKGPSKRQSSPYFVFVTYDGPKQAQEAMCAILRKNYVGSGLGGIRVEWADSTQNGMPAPQRVPNSYPNAWCFWFDGAETAPERDVDPRMSRQGGSPWQPMKLGTFTDQQGFWRVSRGLPTDGNIRLFRDGVHPSWEDKANMGGGRVMMGVRKDECTTVWSDLLSFALLESLDCGELIVGVVMSRRRQDTLNDTISIWLGRHSPEQSAGIVEHLRHQLKLRAYVSIYYKPHQTTSSGPENALAPEKGKWSRGASLRQPLKLNARGGGERRWSVGGPIAHSTSTTAPSAAAGAADKLGLSIPAFKPAGMNVALPSFNLVVPPLPDDLKAKPLPAIDGHLSPTGKDGRPSMSIFLEPLEVDVPSHFQAPMLSPVLELLSPSMKEALKEGSLIGGKEEWPADSDGVTGGSPRQSPRKSPTNRVRAMSSPNLRSAPFDWPQPKFKVEQEAEPEAEEVVAAAAEGAAEGGALAAVAGYSTVVQVTRPDGSSSTTTY